MPLHDTRLQQSGTRSKCVLHCIYATHGTAPRIVYGRPFLPRCLCSSSTHQRASRCLRLFSILVPGYPTQKPCSLLASLGAQTTAGSWSSNIENLDDSLTTENMDTLNSFSFCCCKYLLFPLSVVLGCSSIAFSFIFVMIFAPHLLHLFILFFSVFIVICIAFHPTYRMLRIACILGGATVVTLNTGNQTFNSGLIASFNLNRPFPFLPSHPTSGHHLMSSLSSHLTGHYFAFVYLTCPFHLLSPPPSFYIYLIIRT